MSPPNRTHYSRFFSYKNRYRDEVHGSPPEEQRIILLRVTLRHRISMINHLFTVCLGHDILPLITDL